MRATDRYLLRHFGNRLLIRWLRRSATFTLIASFIVWLGILLRISPERYLVRPERMRELGVFLIWISVGCMILARRIFRRTYR